MHKRKQGYIAPIDSTDTSQMVWTCAQATLNTPVRPVENRLSLNQIKEGRGTPKKTWKETIENDMNYLNLNENM